MFHKAINTGRASRLFFALSGLLISTASATPLRAGLQLSGDSLGHQTDTLQLCKVPIRSSGSPLPADSLAPMGADSTLQISASTTPPDTATWSTSNPAPASKERCPRTSDYTVAPGVTWHYERPKPFRWLLHIPRDIVQFPGYAFQRDKIIPIVKIFAGSALLYGLDEPILAISQDIGRDMGLDARSTQKTLVRIPFSIGSLNLPFEFNAPDNLNSAFYFIGDGWTHLTIATGFLGYGLVARDNRAAQTASQLGEAILSTGVVIQALKRSTGRQSPFVATKERGEWHLFPSISRYQSHVPNYDAYPSGHVATAMATLTVIADNYPEYKFIRPVGYTLIGLLGYSMLNNGVHWASDYPLGIAIGYGFAKIAVKHGRTRVESGNGLGAAPRQPRPWYKQAEWSPYMLGPFTGVSVGWKL
ncbi:phosphatase PAP2 family protein [Hymenobacter sp. ASUV-10]|uniref:Phosphatase PAP2 family protein n=1 Tax=Hymenobacter aranciens TaxID=3063996 RepID=A0ABT9BEZ9_9BACT|nr:phosphatase PAP2 family protein [Hymenobacter sp. ASUV-10]MDO7875607.1 phosphatase PAP2 family protein [Hymenobacter sp. ASUV-10]